MFRDEEEPHTAETRQTEHLLPLPRLDPGFRREEETSQGHKEKLL